MPSDFEVKFTIHLHCLPAAAFGPVWGRSNSFLRENLTCVLSIKTYSRTCFPALWMSLRSVCLASYLHVTCCRDIAMTWGNRKPLATWPTVFGRSLHLDCAYAVHQDIVRTQSRV